MEPVDTNHMRTPNTDGNLKVTPQEVYDEQHFWHLLDCFYQAGPSASGDGWSNDSTQPCCNHNPSVATMTLIIGAIVISVL